MSQAKVGFAKILGGGMKGATLVFTVLACAACASRTGDFTVMSTHTLSTPMEKAAKRVKGASCSHWLLFGLIPFGGKNYKDAVDDALNNDTRYDALVDVVTFDRDWGMLLYGQSCFVIERTLARLGPQLKYSTEPVQLKVKAEPEQ
jgi:hypothetical protein